MSIVSTLVYSAAVLLAAGLAWLVKEILKGCKDPEVDPELCGGDLVAGVLKANGVDTIFCLSGGHIAPVYVGAERLGIKVIDVRHECNSVFAADAYARMTGRVGVACVTAGPGVTNTITAVQNAKMAHSPVVIFGGATSTILKGRGSLQDIDHLSLVSSLVKYKASPSCVADLVPIVERAFKIAQEGVPGPVFVETPMDLIWPAKEVLSQFGSMMPKPENKSLLAIGTRVYMRRHLANIWARSASIPAPVASPKPSYPPSASKVAQVAAGLRRAKRPVLVIGSQAMLLEAPAADVAAAVLEMGVPTYLGGMARGLLGGFPPEGTQYRHKRTLALKAADYVILAGTVCDFRLNYGFSISSKATLVTVNRSSKLVNMNRAPTVGVTADPGAFLVALGAEFGSGGEAWGEWKEELNGREQKRNDDIIANGEMEAPEGLVNPVHLLTEMNKVLDDDSVLVVDGGDFVGTAAYTVYPRQPLAWLDPGQFGTLGVGAGFAMAAKLLHPEKEVWIVWGDGACGFSIMELDTFARHGLGIICVVGNDSGWSQMIRDQERLLKSDCACVLARTDYHIVCEGFGGKGLEIKTRADIVPVMKEAKAIAASGVPVLINCHIARNDFRQGSISV